jgi:ATP-dependent Zn protease
MSEDTQRKVDSEVKKLVDEGYERAKKNIKWKNWRFA